MYFSDVSDDESLGVANVTCSAVTTDVDLGNNLEEITIGNKLVTYSAPVNVATLGQDLGKLALNEEGFTSYHDLDHRWKLLKDNTIFLSDSEDEDILLVSQGDGSSDKALNDFECNKGTLASTCSLINVDQNNRDL